MGTFPKPYFQKPGKPPSLVVKQLHENDCRGILYEFKIGARVWKERQQRFPVINGPMAGSYWTYHEYETNRYHDHYEMYTSARKGQKYTRIYIYVPDIKPQQDKEVKYD